MDTKTKELTVDEFWDVIAWGETHRESLKDTDPDLVRFLDRVGRRVHEYEQAQAQLVEEIKVRVKKSKVENAAKRDHHD